MKLSFCFFFFLSDFDILTELLYCNKQKHVTGQTLERDTGVRRTLFCTSLRNQPACAV